jgi:hypothetical protein
MIRGDLDSFCEEEWIDVQFLRWCQMNCTESHPPATSKKKEKQAKI